MADTTHFGRRGRPFGGQCDQSAGKLIHRPSFSRTLSKWDVKYGRGRQRDAVPNSTRRIVYLRFLGKAFWVPNEKAPTNLSVLTPSD